MIDVVALGEVLIDFASRGTDAKGYPLMQALPGGAPANFLAALTKYGKSTAFLGKVGDDTFGHLLVGTVKDAGIETRGIVVDPAVFTTLAFVTFDASGDRSFSFARKPGADTCLNWEEVDKSLIKEKPEGVFQQAYKPSQIFWEGVSLMIIRHGNLHPVAVFQTATAVSCFFRKNRVCAF